MAKQIKITGSKATRYDLDDIKGETRMASDAAIVIHVHKWNAAGGVGISSSPDPENPVVGQMWLSLKVK